MNSEAGKNALDGVVMATCLMEVPKEGGKVCGGCDGERCDMLFQGGERGLEKKPLDRNKRNRQLWSMLMNWFFLQ